MSCGKGLTAFLQEYLALYWGITGVPGTGGPLDQLKSSEAYASVLHGTGKLYMAPTLSNSGVPMRLVTSSTADIRACATCG
jgi:hypothetical protein